MCRILGREEASQLSSLWSRGRLDEWLSECVVSWLSVGADGRLGTWMASRVIVTDVICLDCVQRSAFVLSAALVELCYLLFLMSIYWERQPLDVLFARQI